MCRAEDTFVGYINIAVLSGSFSKNRRYGTYNRNLTQRA